MRVLTLSIMIVNGLKNTIEQENLREGDKLPSERELREKLNVQRLTLHSGLRALTQERIIISKQRSGYYVSKPKIVENVLHLESTNEAIFEQDLNMGVKILSIEKKETNKRLSTKLRLPLGTKVYCLQRLHIIDDEPISVDTSYLPAKYAQSLEKKDFESRALYQILEGEYDTSVNRSEQGILIYEADNYVANALYVELGTQMVLQQGLAYDNDNHQIKYSESIMKMERFVYMN